ncbi:MAG: sensor histidine kinase [Bacteroidetes bacterium]|nr:MAG: sensor histidine kinase [Bacteroidota bacterium]
MNNLPTSKIIIKWLLILASFLIVTSILWNTNQFFRKFKNEERIKMEVLATAYENFNNVDLDIDISLEEKIIQSNRSIPMIITFENGDINRWQNLDVENTKKFTSLPVDDRLYLSRQLNQMKEENEPLIVNFQQGQIDITEKIYYRDSDLLNKLQYYPLGLVLILFLFGTIIYLAFKSNKIAEQNKLWAGMAKETAHQIGTPLSSIMAWMELLRMGEGTADQAADEIEKDIRRLEIITERFSKIGSIPALKPDNIVKIIYDSIAYLKPRSPKKTSYIIDFPENKEVLVPVNASLFSWVIENLCKNAIDAMDGVGTILITMKEDARQVIIDVSDTGRGISRTEQRDIFNPGYTSKKRGWGLGLSLSKRIIRDYHKGKIFVKSSTMGEGTTFRVIIRKKV